MLSSHASIAQSENSILIVDSSSETLKQIKHNEHTTSIKPCIATQEGEIRSLFANQGYKFYAAVINATSLGAKWLSILALCKIHRPQIPIYLYADTFEATFIDSDSMNALGITKFVRTPFHFSKMSHHIIPNIITLHSKKIRPKRTILNIIIDDVIESIEGEFTPVPTTEFLANTPIPTDIYLNVGPHKFAKILSSQDSFSYGVLHALLTKHFNELYIRQSDQTRITSLCVELYSKATSGTQHLEITRPQSAIYALPIYKFLSRRKFNSNHLNQAVDFTLSAETAIKSIGTSNPILPAYLADPTLYEHAASATLIAALLRKALGFQEDRAVKLVGMTTLLHDIGLVTLPKECQDDDAELTAEQRQLFETHPTKGALIIGELPGIESVMVQAVAQHHERRNRKGFPNQLGAGSINLLAQLIAMSDDYSRIIRKAEIMSDLNPQKEISKLFNGYASQVAEAFRTIFP